VLPEDEEKEEFVKARLDCFSDDVTLKTSFPKATAKQLEDMARTTPQDIEAAANIAFVIEGLLDQPNINLK
jgi:hypothetical protein